MNLPLAQHILETKLNGAFEAVAADGLCFFHALRRQLEQNHTVKELRRLAGH